MRLVGEGYFNPGMLKLAIDVREMSGAKLAKAVGVKSKAVYEYLAGQEPDAETMDKIAKALDFPKDFFYQAGEVPERDPRYPPDMLVGLPLRPPPTRESLAELLSSIPDQELPMLNSLMHEIAEYPDNVVRFETTDDKPVSAPPG